MKHSTISILELFLTIILSGAIFIQVMNLWEGLVDRKYIKEHSDQATKEAVGLAITLDRVLIVVSAFLLLLSVRGMYRAESVSNIGTTIIYAFGVGVCTYTLWASMKGRISRWKILRPTIVQQKQQAAEISRIEGLEA